MAPSRIDAFLAYIAKRGIPERYHALYREEVLTVLMHAGVGSIDRLTTEMMQRSVAQAERQLRNRKAVCAALDEFVRALRKHSRPPVPLTPPPEDPEDHIPNSAKGSSAYPPEGSDDKRRYVRIPFNREVQMSGSLAPVRASDLSLGGMYLETRQAHDAGEIIEVTFKLRREDKVPIVLDGQVVYIDPGMGVGLDFVSVPDDVRREIRYFIEDVIAGRQF
jgi:hypothetical protein